MPETTNFLLIRTSVKQGRLPQRNYCLKDIFDVSYLHTRLCLYIFETAVVLPEDIDIA